MSNARYHLHKKKKTELHKKYAVLPQEPYFHLLAALYDILVKFHIVQTYEHPYKQPRELDAHLHEL